MHTSTHQAHKITTNISGGGCGGGGWPGRDRDILNSHEYSNKNCHVNIENNQPQNVGRVSSGRFDDGGGPLLSIRGGGGGGMLHLYEGDMSPPATPPIPMDEPPVSPMDDNVLESMSNVTPRQSPLRMMMGCIGGAMNPRNLLRSRESTLGAASARGSSRGSSRGLGARLRRARGDAGNENNDVNVPSLHNEVLIAMEAEEWGDYNKPVVQYAWLRWFVATILRRDEYSNQLFSFDDLSSFLTIAIGHDINAEVLEEAFRNGGCKKYVIICNDSFEGINDSFLYVSLSMRKGSSAEVRTYTIATIGCFSTHEAGKGAKVTTPFHSRDSVSTFVLDGFEIGRRDSDSYRKLMKKLQQSTPKSKKKKPNPGEQQQIIIKKSRAAIKDAEGTILAEQATIIAANKELVALEKISEEEALSSQLEDEETAIEEMKTKLASAIKKSKSTKLALSKLQKQDDDNSSMEEDDTDEEEKDEEEEGVVHPENADGAIIVDNPNRPPAKPLLIVHEGRVAKIDVPTHGIVTLDDIVDNYLQLPYEDSAEMRRKRLSAQHEITTCGACQAIVPARFTTVMKGHLCLLKINHIRIKRLMKLYSGKRCRLSPQSMRFLTIFTLHNFSGSDEGTTMTIAGAFYVIIHIEMGIPITAEQLGFMFPSESLLRAWKTRLAAEIFISTCFFINKREVKLLHLSSDHGERKDKDAFVKGVRYGYTDEDGNLRIASIYVDFDKCGHGTDQVVAALKKLVDRIKQQCPQVEFISIEGDNGGGGGVEAIFQELIKAGVLVKRGRFYICNLHGFNNCVEKGSEAAVGKQGMKMKNCLQLGYATITVFRTLKSKLGGKDGIIMLDSLKAMAIDELMNDQNIGEEVAKNNIVAFEEAYRLFSTDDVDVLLEEYKFDRNLQLCVWTRWGTIFAMAKFLKKNWTICYIMLTKVSDTKKSTLAIHKTTGDALSLMKIVHTDEDGNNLGMPVLYAQICWMDAFARAFFDDAFITVKRANPNFGYDSYGCLANMTHLLTFYWKDLLLTLSSNDEAGSWKKHPDFESYRDAVENMPELEAVKEGGKEFFLNLPEVFLEKFMAQFGKHIESCLGVRSEDKRDIEEVMLTWPYMLFGNKNIARLAMTWLLTVTEVGYNNDTEYTFDDPLIGPTIEVSDHVVNKTITIDVQNCMTYLIRNVKKDPHKLLSHPIIEKNLELLTQLAHSDTVVDIFERGDRPSWGGENYEQLINVARDEVVPHGTQNQWMERGVQAFNNMTGGNTGEARATCEAQLWSQCKLRLNNMLTQEMRDEKETQTEKDKVTRGRGRRRATGCVKLCHTIVDNELAEAMEHTDAATRKQVIKDMGTTINKASHDELEKQIDEFEASSGTRKMLAAEMQALSMDITNHMGGTVKTSDMKKGQGHIVHVQAELDERGIVPPQPINAMKWSDVKDLLKFHEYTNMAEKPQHVKIWPDITEIVPLSEMMKDLLVTTFDD